jgi:hypothetical protein
MTDPDHEQLLANFDMSCDLRDRCRKCNQPAIPYMILVGCGHSLCEACANATKKCPACDKEVTSRVPFDRETERIGQSLRYVCKVAAHVAMGCTFVGSAAEAMLHRRARPNPVNAPVVLEISVGRSEDDFSLFVLLSDTILSVKKQLQKLTGRPPATMALKFRDEQMRDDVVLADHYAQFPLSFSLYWISSPSKVCSAANSSPFEPYKEASDRTLELKKPALDADQSIQAKAPCAGAF